MFHLVIPVMILLWGQASQAQRLQPIVQPIGQAEKVIIKGFQGKLQIVASKAETVRVEAQKMGGGDFDRWSFQVGRKQNDLEITVKGPSAQEDWEKVRAQKAPPFDLKVTLPMRPVEIFWAEGEFVAEKWLAPLSLQMTSGKIKVTEGKGPLNLQLIRGRIYVAKHQGPVDLQSFNGKVATDETKGALSVNNHSATYSISQHEGPVELRNHSGLTTLTKVQGRSVVKNVSGVVRLQDYSGSFDGQFTNGALSASVASLQSFNVISDDAAITLDAPKSSGALVNLRSEKGRLQAPGYLRRIKKGLWTERTGRLQGKEQGNIKIISKYGDIVLK